MASHKDILRGHASVPDEGYVESLTRATLTVGSLSRLDDSMAKALDSISTLKSTIADMERRLDRLGAPK